MREFTRFRVASVRGFPSGFLAIYAATDASMCASAETRRHPSVNRKARRFNSSAASCNVQPSTRRRAQHYAHAVRFAWQRPTIAGELVALRNPADLFTACLLDRQRRARPGLNDWALILG